MNMFTVVWKMFFFCFILRPVYARHIAQCKDRHVWIGGGAADCMYLEIKSDWGIHGDPVTWCNSPYTECCETCARLLKKGVPGTKNTGKPTVPSVQEN